MSDNAGAADSNHGITVPRLASVPSATYVRWDGSQQPFAPDLDVAALLDEMADDWLNGLGGRAALRDLLRRGPQGTRGLDDLRVSLAQRRGAQSDLADIAAPLRAVQRELDAIVDLEMEALADRDDPAAMLSAMDLETLPDDLGRRVAALRRRPDWASPEAQRRFEALDDQLRKELLDAWFQDLTQGVERVTPDDVAQVVAMLTDLNDLLDARDRGEDIDQQFRDFLDKHGHHFPQLPEDLDQLAQMMASRMAGMARLLAELSDEQRRELLGLNRQVLDDPELDEQLARLWRHLGPMELPPGAAMPGDGQPMPMGTPSSFAQAVAAMQQLNAMDALDGQLAGMAPGSDLANVDDDLVEEVLGSQAAEDLRRLREIERLLEESGAVRRRGGELELTPRGARLLGERSLVKLLERIRKRPSTTTHGADPELTGQVRPWRFGDTEPIDVRQTVTNAVLRTASHRGAIHIRGAGAQPPAMDAVAGVRLSPEDLAVAETEVRPRTATALLLDLSWSMPLQGHFVPAKRMALALASLIQGKHRQDSLHLIGFSDYARRMQPAELGGALHERVYGTNMQHAFLMARRLLAEDPRPVKQVIMVTDGEPTAHLEGDRAEFNWPPVERTLTLTLQEAKRLARLGASIHVFLLEDAPGLVAFAERLAKVTGGTVTPIDSNDLGGRIISEWLDPW